MLLELLLAAFACAEIPRVSENHGFHILPKSNTSSVAYFQLPFTRFVMQPAGQLGADARLYDDVIEQQGYWDANDTDDVILIYVGRNFCGLSFNLSKLENALEPQGLRSFLSAFFIL